VSLKADIIVGGEDISSSSIARCLHTVVDAVQHIALQPDGR